MRICGGANEIFSFKEREYSLKVNFIYKLKLVGKY